LTVAVDKGTDLDFAGGCHAEHHDRAVLSAAVRRLLRSSGILRGRGGFELGRSAFFGLALHFLLFLLPFGCVSLVFLEPIVGFWQWASL
jgi:hypothetical protein